MLLQFSDDRVFARGACPYEYRPATEREMSPRILIEVEIEGVRTQAMVDTGGVYLICHPEFAELLDLDDTVLVEKKIHMAIPRYGRVEGNLYFVSLTLLAEEGYSCEWQVTAFVPRHLTSNAPVFPSVMGLHGCLEKLRFAVDPSTDTFYFGTLSDKE